MFRTLQGPVVVAGALVVAATIYAVIDDNLANVLIAAAVVYTVGLILHRLIDQRVGDIYDAGRKAERRAIEREIAAFLDKYEKV